MSIESSAASRRNPADIRPVDSMVLLIENNREQWSMHRGVKIQEADM